MDSNTHAQLKWGTWLMAGSFAGTLFCMSAGMVIAAEAVPTNAALKNNELGEIVVTAEKRAVKLQDLPSSITAVTAEKLDQQNLVTFTDLDSKVPGLVLTRAQGFERAVSIRGLGKEAQQNGNALPSVAVHQDGVFMPSAVALNADFLDVERVEVLRGPQGTVYGQNSTGGAINVISKLPRTDAAEAEADIAVGNYNLSNVRAAVNVPLSNTTAIRVSGSHLEHSGFTKNVFIPGQALDDENNTSARIQLLSKLSDNFQIVLRAQHFDTDVGARALKNVLDTTPGRNVSQQFPGHFKYNADLYSATFDYNLSFATLKSITGWQDESIPENSYDSAGLANVSPFVQEQNYTPRNNQKRHVFSQELNLVSNPGASGNVDWLVGAFFYRYRIGQDYVDFYDGNRDGIVNTTENPANPFTNPDLDFQTNSPNASVRKSWSVYTQETLHLNDAWAVTGGLRYSKDKSNGEFNNYYLAFGAKTTFVVFDTNYVSGKLGLEWHYAPGDMAYVSYTRGVKPGGTNLSVGATNTYYLVQPTFDKETIDAIEVGSKARIFGDRGILNAAAFYYNYKGYQFLDTDPLPFAGGVDNIPKTRIAGIEMEMSVNPTERLSFEGNITLLDTKVTSDKIALDNKLAVQGDVNLANSLGKNPNDLFFAPPTFTQDPRDLAARQSAEQNLNGNQLARAPKFMASLAVGYDVDLTSDNILRLSLSASHRGSQYSRIFNNPGADRVPAYTTTDLSIGIRPRVGQWQGSVTVSNLFDVLAINNKFTDAFGVATTSREFAPPRQFIARVGYKF